MAAPTFDIKPLFPSNKFVRKLLVLVCGLFFVSFHSQQNDINFHFSRRTIVVVDDPSNSLRNKIFDGLDDAIQLRQKILDLDESFSGLVDRRALEDLLSQVFFFSSSSSTSPS